LLCPVGLRFHALHHLFPGLPYHNLEKAHGRLSTALPVSSDYHLSNLHSVWQGWRELRTRKNTVKLLRPKPFPKFILFAMLIVGSSISTIVYKNSQLPSSNESNAINNPIVIDIVGNVNKVLGGTKQKIELGMRIKIGDIIETENRSFIKILTPAKSSITINHNSKLIWSENSLNIIEGNLFAEVKKKDIPSVYHLTAPDNSHIAITGTAFEWSYQSKNKNAELKVKEGVVEFYRGAEKKVTLQNQSLSTNDFIYGAKNILASSVAPWLKSYASIKNEKDCFIDNFNDTKFDSFWLLTSTQKINQSSPKNGLKCSGKDQRVELSSQELVMNHKDTILVSFSAGAMAAKGDFEYGYEVWNENKMVLTQGVLIAQLNAEEYQIKQIHNIGGTKELGDTIGKIGKIPNVSFELNLTPAKEIVLDKVEYKTGNIVSDIVMGSKFNKFKVVFYLKTISENSKATWHLKQFAMGKDEESMRANLNNDSNKAE
jgi:hypothetical protein